MAITGKAALDDSVAAEVVEALMVPELRPAFTGWRSFIRFAVGGNSTVASFALWGDPGAAAAPGDDLTEITSTALSDSQVSATAAEVGFRVDVSDLIRETHASDVYAVAAGMCSKAIQEKYETDIAAMMDDFTSNSNTTTASSTLTPSDLLSAMSALEQRDIPKPYVAYLDPKQTGELRDEIAFSTATLATGGDAVQPFGDSGWFTTYMGLPIWQSSLTVTTSGLVGGAVFAANQALGIYEIRGPRVETQRDASYRTLEFVGSAAYGLAEISDTRGQTLKSAA